MILINARVLPVLRGRRVAKIKTNVYIHPVDMVNASTPTEAIHVPVAKVTRAKIAKASTSRANLVLVKMVASVDREINIPTPATVHQVSEVQIAKKTSTTVLEINVKMVVFASMALTATVANARQLTRVLIAKETSTNVRCVPRYARMEPPVLTASVVTLVSASMDGLDLIARLILTIVPERLVSTAPLASIESVVFIVGVHQEKQVFSVI